jgi:hypothetical protein
VVTIKPAITVARSGTELARITGGESRLFVSIKPIQQRSSNGPADREKVPRHPVGHRQCRIGGPPPFRPQPAFDVVGVLCNRPEKVGKDAGELVGTAPIGVFATNDKDAIEALDADCVFYAPLWSDPDEVCRLLRGGKNVVASGGAWWYRTEHSSADIDKIEAACHEGGTSFHAGGVNPGFASDLLVLTLARIVSRIDAIHIYEVVNFGKDTLKYLYEMGMGSDLNRPGNPGGS